MNRTDRLLAIILELQARGQQRAEDLATTFEVSKRTIYRDILALMESGIPIVSIPGQGYSLIEGFFLPPVNFTLDEATLLLLGGNLVAKKFDVQYRNAAQSAGRKIMAVLPEALQLEVQTLQESIFFVEVGTVQETLLAKLRSAIIAHQSVQFTYYARATEEHSVRTVNPYGLTHFDKAWYLVAHCHLRNDIRRFRLDRISQLTILDKRFTRPAHFQLHQPRDDDRPLTVRVLFSPEVQRWVLEAPSFFQVNTQERPEGLLVTLQVREERELVSWLLQWGRHVKVLEPESLKKLLIEEVRMFLENQK
ncbi:MAG: YafY family transcriptional regulator [Anaerolineae bacterium]|nr:YafY family transcriptional regulator [Anaerolineae bacterium]